MGLFDPDCSDVASGEGLGPDGLGTEGKVDKIPFRPEKSILRMSVQNARNMPDMILNVSLSFEV